MKRLVFIVEGQTEVQFINKIVIPYFSSLGFPNCNAQTIISNRKKHSKGGVQTYQKFKNEIERTLSQGNVVVTTLIDYFKLPTSFPNFSTDPSKIEEIEKGIILDFDNNPNVIPYIQMHEFEALLFSDIDGFQYVIDDDFQLDQIKQIIKLYPNPEDINDAPETAPSKRCERIFSYKKTVYSEMIFSDLEINSIREKCPRFNQWIMKLTARLHS